LKTVALGPAYPMRGGVASFNESFSCMLIEHRWEVLNISYSSRFPRFLFPMKIPLEPGIRPMKLEIEPLIHAGNPFTWFRVVRRIGKFNASVIIVHYWSPWLAPCLGFILGRLHRKTKESIRMVAVLHQVKKERSPVKNLLNRYFLRKCHGFLIMSRTILKELEESSINRPTRFVPHPVYRVFGEKVGKKEARAFLKLDPDEPLILFFGIVRPYKGLDILLKAMATEEVRKLFLRLIVAGEFFEGKEEYEKMIRTLKLENNVILMDEFIPTSEVKYYFCAADLIIQPYLEASQSGITQIAYQFERPMLVTDVGGLKETVLHEKVGYVSPVDPAAISGYIVDFYTNHREEEFVKNLAVEKKRFDWENMFAGLTGLLEEIG